MEVLLRLDIPRVFKSQTCPHWASNNSSVAAEVFLLWCWFSQRFLVISFHSGEFLFSVSTYLCLFWQQQFAPWPQLSDKTKSYWFSVCSYFHLLLDRVMTSLHTRLFIKPEVLSLIFYDLVLDVRDSSFIFNSRFESHNPNLETGDKKISDKPLLKIKIENKFSCVFR